MDPFSLQPDLETTKVIEMDKNKMYIKRVGAHGFWRLNLDKGQLPDHMLGDYTSADRAIEAAKLWIEVKKRSIVSTQV